MVAIDLDQEVCDKTFRQVFEFKGTQSSLAEKRLEVDHISGEGIEAVRKAEFMLEIESEDKVKYFSIVSAYFVYF